MATGPRSAGCHNSSQWSACEAIYPPNITRGQDNTSSHIVINPFDVLYIKVIFIILYIAVFALCFFGNLLVIFVVLKHRKMRTVTNFFLANLAVADLCVGIFCVLPHLSQYLSPEWKLGRVMCKLYYCVQAMSYAASIVILTVISIERYFAILHPFRSKMITTIFLLRVVVIIIWIIAMGCGIPFLIFYDQVQIDVNSYFCVNMYKYKGMFNNEVYVLTNFIVWYVLPLVLMTVMYTRISIVLWKTSKLGGARGVVLHTAKFVSKCKSPGGSTDGKVNLRMKKLTGGVQVEEDSYESTSLGRQTSLEENHSVHRQVTTEEEVADSTDSALGYPGRGPDTEDDYMSATATSEDEKLQQHSAALRQSSSGSSHKDSESPSQHNNSHANSNNCVTLPLKGHQAKVNKAQTARLLGKPIRHRLLSRLMGGRAVRFSEQSVDRGENVLLARRRVIRLLITVIVTFAVCVLPNHIHLLITLWNRAHGVSFSDYLGPPITYLVFYLNSALNPILYAFLSDNFRKSLSELFGSLKSNTSFRRSGRSTLSVKTGNSVL